MKEKKKQPEKKKLVLVFGRKKKKIFDSGFRKKKLQNLFLVFREKKIKERKKIYIWHCGFPFWIQGGEPPLTKNIKQTNWFVGKSFVNKK